MAAPSLPPPNPLDRAALGERCHQLGLQLELTRRNGAGTSAVVSALFSWSIAVVARLFPMRVWNLYVRRRGPLLAAGCAYRMFFSIAAMLVAGFAILGIFAAGNPVLSDGIIDIVADGVPGLLNTGEGGLATPEQLLGSTRIGPTLIISLAALLITSLGWITGIREGIRTVLGLARDRTNPIVSKLRDLGTLGILAVALLATSVLGIASTSVLERLAGVIEVGVEISWATTRLVSLVVMLLLDVAVSMVLFRVASRVRMPKKVLWTLAIASGLGASVLRYFSALLLGSLTSNPVLAPFAVILGLFVWFFLLSQVYLACAAVGAVMSADLKHAKA
ncbi:YihY/virulence factor BrkB family protein [Paeniglutamicibacter cryotolerans]